MLLHEVLEKAATSFLIFRDVLFQCRYRHSAHVARCTRAGGATPETSRRFTHHHSESDRHPGRSRLSCEQLGKLDRQQPDYLTSESPFCRSAAFTRRREAGNCSTVACWPSHSRVSSTVSPSGNSTAS